MKQHHKLTLGDCGVVRNAVIELDGITVLCGYNDTGKSAVCREVVKTAYRARKINVGELGDTTLFSGETLVIECPENNAHPQRQVEIAKKIALACRNEGVRIFMTTYSTYILRGIEVFSQEYELETRCHYYKTEPINDDETLFRLRNVDSETKLIYHDFYMPFEEL